MTTDNNDNYISSKNILYGTLVIISILLGTISFFVNSTYLIIGMISVILVVIIFKYEYIGLIIYLIIFLLRPGETYPVLAEIRPEFLLGAYLGVLALVKNKYKYGKVTIPKSKLNYAFIFLLWGVGLSLTSSACKTCTIEVLEALVKLGVFYLLIILMVNTKKRLEIFFWVYILAIAKMAIDIDIGFLQGQATDYHGLSRASGGSSAVDNFNGIAITMNTVIPFAYYLFFHYKTLFKKSVIGIILVILIVTLILTGSRGGLLGFLTILGFIWWRSNKKVLLAITLLVFVIFGWFSMEPERQTRYLSIFASEEERDESAQGRINAWIDGMYLFVDHPITGVGAGAFADARVKEFGVYLQPHSMYVQILTELGLIGALLYFFFLGQIIVINKKVIKILHNRGSPTNILDTLAWASIITCFCLMVTGIFAHSGYRFSWYVLAALTVVAEKLTKDADPEDAALPLPKN